MVRGGHNSGNSKLLDLVPRSRTNLSAANSETPGFPDNPGPFLVCFVVKMTSTGDVPFFFWIFVSNRMEQRVSLTGWGSSGGSQIGSSIRMLLSTSQSSTLILFGIFEECSNETPEA